MPFHFIAKRWCLWQTSLFPCLQFIWKCLSSYSFLLDTIVPTTTVHAHRSKTFRAGTKIHMHGILLVLGLLTQPTDNTECSTVIRVSRCVPAYISMLCRDIFCLKQLKTLDSILMCFPFMYIRNTCSWNAQIVSLLASELFLSHAYFFKFFKSICVIISKFWVRGHSPTVFWVLVYHYYYCETRPKSHDICWKMYHQMCGWCALLAFCSINHTQTAYTTQMWPMVAHTTCCSMFSEIPNDRNFSTFFWIWIIYNFYYCLFTLGTWTTLRTALIYMSLYFIPELINT
jgi:hypothetical protein